MKYHLSNVYPKLHVASRTEAVRYAFQHGLVENPLVAGESGGSDGELSRSRRGPE